MNGSPKLGSGGTPENPTVSKGGGGGTKLGRGGARTGRALSVAFLFASDDNGGGWLSTGAGRGGGGGGGPPDLLIAKGDGAGDVGGGGDSKVGMGEAGAGEASEESALGSGEEAGVAVPPNDNRVKLASDGTDERRG